MRHPVLVSAFVTATLLASLAGAAGWYLYAHPEANPFVAAPLPPPPEPTVRTVGGETVVSVAPDVQRASGILVSPLATTTRLPGKTAWATVVDPVPLIALHERLVAARSELELARVQEGVSSAGLKRGQAIFDDDRGISRSALDDAGALARADRARLSATRAALDDALAEIRQGFGEALASAAATAGLSPDVPPNAMSAALADPSPDTTSGVVPLPALLAGRASLVRVTLPAPADGRPPSIAPKRIVVDGPDGAVSADLLSVSPRADPVVQGNAWLYASAAPLPVDFRTVARLPDGALSEAAVVVPETAVLRYGGEAWAYVRTAPDRFTRRRVPTERPIERGYLASAGFAAGGDVVTRGAQLLLSEELRPQGIATACKDPPECDD